jgi:hypothetical protein
MKMFKIERDRRKRDGETRSAEVESVPSSISATAKDGSGRTYQEKCLKLYPWIDYNRRLDKVYCTVCKCASDSKLPLPTSTRSEKDSYKASVANGFSQWRLKVQET